MLTPYESQQHTVTGYTWLSYSIELRGGSSEFGQRQPRVGVAREAISDEAQLTRTVDGRRAVTVSVCIMHISLSN